MALLNIETALRRVRNALKKTKPPAGLEILSYKRNRGITVLKLSEDIFYVRERGYEEGEHEVSGSELPKLLKSMMKREFPRSRKLRIYQLEGPEEVDQPRKTL